MPSDTATAAWRGPSDRNATIDLLRGLAAISVAFYHISNGNPSLMKGQPVARVGEWGWLGVDVFFVISGFVIPYALERGGYRLRDAGRFLVKRVVRIDPPFFATIVATLVMGWISAQMPSYRGKPFAIDGVALLLHVGYLTEIFHRPWVLPAFWTLALEFQYYLLMALCYPLVHHRNAAVRLLTIGGWALVSLLPVGREWVPGWGAWFALGILAHTYRAGRLNRWSFVAAVAACGVIVGIHGIPVQGVVTAIVALVIGFVTLERPRLVLLGTLSYSLYLVHEPVGGRIVNLATHFDGRPAWLNVCVVAAALTVSLLAAGLLHRFVEGPSQRLSSRIRFARRAA